MVSKIMTHIRTYLWVPLLLAGLALGLVGVAYAGTNIDPTDKYAWGTNVGWINFADANGGVTVHSDHLEGYAWGENIGWIRLGSTGGGSPYYANDAADTYGVNNDGCGNLSGYAWGTNVGWIKFDPSHGGVAVDPVGGDFDGYVWGGNVGWIHFQNASPAYKVNTAWRGDLTATYQNDIAAIITSRRPDPASSSGLSVADVDFLNDADDCIILGHNNEDFANVTEHLPPDVDKRWARIWQLDVSDGAGYEGGEVDLTFDISEAGGQYSFSDTGTYYLLTRATGSSGAFTKVTVVSSSVSIDQLTFRVDAANLGSEFTLGATADSPTAVEVQSFGAGAGRWMLGGWLGLAGLLALGVTALVLVRRWCSQ